MKKTIIFLLVFLVIATLATAQSESNSSATITTDEQVEARHFSLEHGAQVRLSILERAVTRSVLIGERVVDIIQENHPNESVVELNVILDQLNVTLAEIKTLDPAADDAVASFVTLKKTARDVIKEFRDTARPLLTNKDKQELRSESTITLRLKTINGRVKEVLSEANARRAQAVLARLQETNTTIIARIRAGNYSTEDIRAYFKERFEKLNGTRAHEVRLRIQQARNATVTARVQSNTTAQVSTRRTAS